MVMLMVKAGAAVDEFIEQLIPLLSPGDVIIDGGNTHYTETERRTTYVESKGLLYIGTGVSGGEEVGLAVFAQRERGRCLGDCEQRCFPVAEERGFPPCREQVELLLRHAQLPGLPGVEV